MLPRWWLTWTFFAVFAALSGARAARAEPWLSTRFAQNCAGCHAPGRKNLEPSERRCTLSCQGCHVNPNGGGLRSYYGKWNENRWLRSFRSDLLRNDKATAPLAEQRYGKHPYDGTAGDEGDESGGAEGGAKDAKGAKGAKDAKTAGSTAKKKGPGKLGFPLAELDTTEPGENHYTRADGQEKITAKSDDEFKYQIPRQDPYRTLDLTKTTAGADIRWEAYDSKVSGGKSSVADFLMDADFGVESRPLYRNLHFVYEARIEGNPNPGTKYEAQLGTARTRSLYAMVDDLPYNTFVMGGYYRPLFGNYVPDHYTLAQEMTSYGLTGDTRNYNLLFTALSIGTAPNVPYLNLHIVGKDLTTGDPADNTNGIAANLGMRFVTMGGSFNYSYWRSSDSRATVATATELHSISVAGRIGPTTANIEGTSVARDVNTTDYRLGGVFTLDTQTQVWKENYVTAMIAKANTTTELLPGEAQQVKTGFRSFWVPGVETWVLVEYRTDHSQQVGTTITTQDVQAQVHLFF